MSDLVQVDSRSMNHQFEFIDKEPVERWAKTVIYRLHGKRLSPEDDKEQLEFALVTRDDGEQLEWQFHYSDDVIELYSERDALIFKRLNHIAIRNGLLVPYDAEHMPDGMKLPFSEGELD